MRKAAIVNHFRRRVLSAQREAAERQMHSTVLLPYWTRSRPEPQPSPLGGPALIQDDEDDAEYDPYGDEDGFDADDEDSLGDL